MSKPASAPTNTCHDRWPLLRDLAVFAVKLLLDNVRALALVPLSFIAVALDLTAKGHQERTRFYKVLRWGRQCGRMIDLYSAIESERKGSHSDDVDGQLPTQ